MHPVLSSIPPHWIVLREVIERRVIDLLSQQIFTDTVGEVIALHQVESEVQELEAKANCADMPSHRRSWILQDQRQGFVEKVNEHFHLDVGLVHAEIDAFFEKLE